MLLRELQLSDRIELEKALMAPWGDFHFALDPGKEILKDYPGFLQKLANFQLGMNLPEGFVPSLLYFAFNEQGKMVGRLSIRKKLNDFLRFHGGHIGYAVVPDERQKGYATEILRQGLELARDFCEDQTYLVTCKDENVGSIKTIEKNGGVFKDYYDFQEHKHRRYLIKASAREVSK